MKNILLNLVLPFLLCSCAHAQPPGLAWQKSLGGSDFDWAASLRPTIDGGCIVAGHSESTDGDVSQNQGGNWRDVWIVKLNASSGIQWEKSIGGTQAEAAYSIEATSDGGYILAGWSDSNDGDVSGNHGGADYWIVKLNATGAIQWQKSLGGSGDDIATVAQPTTDGGYIVAGSTISYNGDVSGNHGEWDCWIVKLDANGAIQWQKCLGGTSWDEAYSIIQVADGGYIVAGSTISYNGDVSGNHGFGDCWVVKLNATGAIQWQKCLGGSEKDEARDIQATADGGYIVVGVSESNDGDVSGNHGNADCWVVKLSASGTIQWQKSLGGTGNDMANSVQATPDGGYIVAGTSDSNDGDVSGNHSLLNDCWVVKLTATGAVQWQKSLGGTLQDNAAIVRNTPTTPGGYFVAGTSNSNDGDVSGNHGVTDIWVLKINPLTHPANDGACFATLIPADGTVQPGFTNETATVASGENALTPPGNDCANSWCEIPSNQIGASVWFRFTAPGTGAVEISTCGMADFNTQIAAYSAGDCDNFGTYTLLAANDNGAGCPGYTSKMNVGALTPGQTYYILVDGWGGTVGDFSIQVTPIMASAAQEAVAGSPLLTAYPNPTSGLLTVRFDGQLTMQACTLSDLTGKTVTDLRWTNPVPQTELDLGGLPPGLYLLQARSGERVFSEKIIVQ